MRGSRASVAGIGRIERLVFIPVKTAKLEFPVVISPISMNWTKQIASTLFLLLLLGLSASAESPLSRFGVNTNAINVSAPEGSFSFAQLGDTQYLTNCLVQWTNTINYLLAKKPKTLFMPGDLADGAHDSEYISQTNQLSRIIAAGIPLFVVPGNHDSNRKRWEQYLTPLLLSQPNIAETYLPGQTYDGIVMTQNFAGLKLVYIGLGPFSFGNASVLAWSRAMSQKYQDRLAIAVVHGYIDEFGGIMEPSDPWYLGGDIFHTNFMAMANLAQVLCGHEVIYNFLGPTYHHVAVGNSGNLVHGLLFNFQCSPPYIGGASVGCGNFNCGLTWVRWYEWKPSLNQVSATTWDNYGQTNRMTSDFQLSFPVWQQVPAHNDQANTAGQAILSSNPNWVGLTNQLEFCMAVTTGSDSNALADFSYHHYSGIAQRNDGTGLVSEHVPNSTQWLTNRAMNGIRSLHFAGPTNQMQFGRPDSFLGFSSLTLSAWVRTSMSRYPAYILSKHVSGNAGQFLIGMNSPTDIRFFVITTAGRVNLDATTQPINDGSWHLVCGTYDGTKETAYFDGKLVNQVPQTGVVVTNTQSLLLVSGFMGGAGNGWDGDLEEINLWSRALKAEEIGLLYDSRVSVGDILTIPSLAHGAQ